MATGLRAIGVVLLLAALAYILYLWSKRRDRISCPECGAEIDMYAEECPHCGHRKKPMEAHDHDEDHDKDYDKEQVEEGEEEDEGDEEVEDAGEEAAYVCDECGKGFDSERGLKIHSGMKH